MVFCLALVGYRYAEESPKSAGARRCICVCTVYSSILLSVLAQEQAAAHSSAAGMALQRPFLYRAILSMELSSYCQHGDAEARHHTTLLLIVYLH